jgi:excinuclease ABC subunit A
MTTHKHIRVKGARVHNLKAVDLELPRDQLVVLTGLSGSGKSSLAFDTIYAEGQRRYVESLSSYARQFLEMQDKPDVDLIEGLSPAISIEQKTTSKNPRSTVATVTEIHDYLRLLFARVGKPFCHNCGKPIEGRTSSQIVDAILAYETGARISILSPIVRDRKGEYKKDLEALRQEGFVRVRVDGENHLLEDDISMDKKRKHTIEVVVDRIVVHPDARLRIADAVELALHKGGGLVVALRHKKSGDEEELFSESFACIDCGISYPDMEPRLFSFNAPQGACPTCSGLGNIHTFDETLIVPNPDLSLEDGALRPWGGAWKGYYNQMLAAVAEHFGFDTEKAWRRLSKKAKKIVLYGTDEEIEFNLESEKTEYTFSRTFEGVIPNLQRRQRETSSDRQREELERFMVRAPCDECEGARLRLEARHVKVADTAIHQVSRMSIGLATDFFGKLKLSARDEHIAKAILKEINSRLQFLNAVGLEYLTLDRAAGTLSGGEAQRIRLATQIGSALVGVLYVLDEPSIGLHQRDNEKLLATLKRLRDLGNTVLVVEHDEETILEADYVVDMGPGAGHLGGEVVVAGSPQDVMDTKASLTGQYLSRKLRIDIPPERRAGHGQSIVLKGARGNNLQEVRAEFPLGKLVCVTGVSGSGKSTLVIDTLYRALAQAIYETRERPLPFADIEGLTHIDKVIDIDQSPIGRTPRSNPATYTGVFDEIRKLFAQLPDAKTRGYGPGRFSFNVKGGRCESCQGGGLIKIEMNFLPDVYVTCEVCKGKRYNPETLTINYKGRTISDVLDMTVAQARAFFSAIPALNRRLKTLEDVGLGYIHLGQAATTLSGGEAQRVKLSKELSKRATGKTVYILDEPTTGLHFHDVKHLLEVLHRLADHGNTVIVIEHNLDVIKTADWIIDMGPEGGTGGGQVLVAGTPEDVAAHKKSHTGAFLKELLKRDGHTEKSRPASKKAKDDVLNKVKGRRAKKGRIQARASS